MILFFEMFFFKEMIPVYFDALEFLGFKVALNLKHRLKRLLHGHQSGRTECLYNTGIREERFHRKILPFKCMSTECC